MQFATLSEVVQAKEVDDLQSICSKFPSNSECGGYKATSPISLDTRSGEKAKCLFTGEEKGKRCKVDLSDDQVKLYFEIGEGLDVLGGEKNTQEVVIPMKTIKSFSYSEKSKTDVGAVLALGVWGLFAKQKKSTIAIRYEGEAEGSQKQVVFVSGRKNGRKIRQKLELQTGLVADILDIDR
ncbi:hypothetical protein [Rivularia sp. UHCC 0363]|uniref:hypothetical protein n=1 Tax=Rivularia sp. UHCC 0363 TaxID=3110244 RepID=UPI002B20D91B|nr:hypothetical protein [Rivularia sp. UHCC 0363]MEA5597592.1 hypothetical protein [Rivularia sp. UHCC 0363]